MMPQTKNPIGSPARRRNGFGMWKLFAESIMDIELPLDFKEFLRLLNAKGVQYLLIGGYAVAYHGYPRATGNIDIWIAVNPDNAEKIVSALREFGFDLPELTPELFIQQNKIVRMGNPPLRIEVSTGISGVKFEECFADKTVGVFDGIEVPIISLEKLKQNKRAAGRSKDLNDLENL